MLDERGEDPLGMERRPHKWQQEIWIASDALAQISKVGRRDRGLASKPFGSSRLLDCVGVLS